jgi:hypothetical protein
MVFKASKKRQAIDTGLCGRKKMQTLQILMTSNQVSFSEFITRTNAQFNTQS